MTDKYILNDQGEPVPCHDLETWAKWFEKSGNQRGVARDNINGVDVSTVFLGLDHSFGDGGEPLLWETMTFHNGTANYTERCGGSREQAEAMHQRIVEKVRAES